MKSEIIIIKLKKINKVPKELIGQTLIAAKGTIYK